MAFVPQTLDGPAAAQRLLGFGTYRSGWCLEAVWAAMNAPSSDSPGSYLYARNIWERAPESRKHYGDRNAPVGSVLLFSGTAGHIAIGLGGERIASTDRPSGGRTGESSISEIERDWGRDYWGWTDWLGGHNIIVQGGGGDGSLAVDGDWGPLTTRALQRALGVEVDGEFGPITTAALQRRVGAIDDGIFGPNSKRALQHYLGVYQDGLIGPITVRALQSRLNAGTF